MLILGLGIGSFLQVMTLAVQNAVPRSELGVATGTVTFFRSIGSSLGGSIFGAILTVRLSEHLAKLLPSSAHQDSSLSKNVSSGISPAYLRTLPHTVTEKIYQAFVMSFHDMFLLVVPVMLLGFVVALFLKEKPLRETTSGPAEIV
jgi:MFS family permease